MTTVKTFNEVTEDVLPTDVRNRVNHYINCNKPKAKIPHEMIGIDMVRFLIKNGWNCTTRNGYTEIDL